jgi:hypothetical protein
MEYKTKTCKALGHPEIGFRCDKTAIPPQDAEWLVSLLERQVAGGAIYRDGETLQVGWMINRFVGAAGGELRLNEPDMKNVLVTIVDSMTLTLKHLRAQKDVYESCSLKKPILFPSIQHRIVVHRSYVTLQNLFLGRDAPHDDDSGWVLQSVPPQDVSTFRDNYETISLYELGRRRPDLIPFLALPEGTGVHIAAGDAIRILADGSELIPRSGSYLAALNSDVS